MLGKNLIDINLCLGNVYRDREERPNIKKNHLIFTLTVLRVKQSCSYCPDCLNAFKSHRLKFIFIYLLFVFHRE